MSPVAEVGKQWVPVVPLTALPKGERRVIIQDGETILLLWYKDEVFAIENKSPAEGAYSEGLLNAKLTQVSYLCQSPLPPFSPLHLYGKDEKIDFPLIYVCLVTRKALQLAVQLSRDIGLFKRNEYLQFLVSCKTRFLVNRELLHSTSFSWESISLIAFLANERRLSYSVRIFYYYYFRIG